MNYDKLAETDNQRGSDMIAVAVIWLGILCAIALAIFAVIAAVFLFIMPTNGDYDG